MSHAIIVSAYGGPEALKWTEVPDHEPAAGQVLVKHTAIGVNFHDVYVRSGAYKTLALPD